MEGQKDFCSKQRIRNRCSRMHALTCNLIHLRNVGTSNLEQMRHNLAVIRNNISFSRHLFIFTFKAHCLHPFLKAVCQPMLWLISRRASYASNRDKYIHKALRWGYAHLQNVVSNLILHYFGGPYNLEKAISQFDDNFFASEFPEHKLQEISISHQEIIFDSLMDLWLSFKLTWRLNCMLRNFTSNYVMYFHAKQNIDFWCWASKSWPSNHFICCTFDWNVKWPKGFHT